MKEARASFAKRVRHPSRRGQMIFSRLPMIAAVLLTAAAPTHGTSTCDQGRTLDVLFVGNSYTYVNNMPRMVEAVAASLRGPCIRTAMIATGGATLAEHWAADTVLRRLRERHWSFVVLQDQSEFGESWQLNGRSRVGTSGAELREYGGRFARAVRAAGATPLLLAHWSDDSAPVRDQQALDFAFASVAREARIAISPVGEAVKRVRGTLPEVSPYHEDGHHLSPAGSYLETLVLYSSLTGRSPLGATRSIKGAAVDFSVGTVYADSIVTLVDVPDAVASGLQQLAATVYDARRGKTPLPVAPASLSAEFPKLASHGEPINARALAGHWAGTSTVLATPTREPVEVELHLRGSAQTEGGADSIFLRVPGIMFAGAVSLRADNKVAVLSGSVTPLSRRGRTGPPQPFTIELRAMLHDSTLSGMATMHQPGQGRLASFTAVGELTLTRR